MNIYEQKLADFRNAIQGLPEHFGQHAAAGAGAAVAGAAIGGLGVAVSKLYDAATKSRDFRQMLATNPDLTDMHESNPKQFNQMFTSLRAMNPEFSKDPLVAGEYMRRMSADPNRAGGYLTEAVSHRDRFPSPVMDTYLKGGIEGLKGTRQGPGGPSAGGRPSRSRPVGPGSNRWEENDLGTPGKPPLP